MDLVTRHAPPQKKVCWSFAALLKGKWPAHDSSNTSLKKGDRGTEVIAGGFRGVLCRVMGGAEFFANSFHLTCWFYRNPCLERDPQNESRTLILNHIFFSGHKQGRAQENRGSNHLLFHRIPGLATKFVQGDALHILWVYGVVSHLLGSILLNLCWHDEPANQTKPPSKRLALVWGHAQRAYKAA